LLNKILFAFQDGPKTRNSSIAEKNIVQKHTRESC